jgi:hypothetical protein
MLAKELGIAEEEIYSWALKYAGIKVCERVGLPVDDLFEDSPWA